MSRHLVNPPTTAKAVHRMSQLRANVIANYFGAGWTALMTLAFVPLYIRYLGMESYALIGLFAMLQGWLSLLDLGMAPTISRELARTTSSREDARASRTLLRTIEFVAVGLATSIVLVFFLISHFMATSWLAGNRLSENTIARCVTVMGIVIGLRLVENVFRSALIGLQRQVELNVVSGSVATMRGLGAVAVLAVEPTVIAYFAWQVLVSVISVCAFTVATYRVLPRPDTPARFSPLALRNVAGFAAGSMAITCLSLGIAHVDKVILSRMLSLEAFGHYAFAVLIAQAPLALVGPVALAFYPRLTAYHQSANVELLSKSYHASSQVVAVLLASSVAMFLFFGRPMLLLWTGDAALASTSFTLAAVLMAGTFLNGVVTIPYYLQLAAGWTSLTIRANAVALVIVVPTLLLAVPRYGVMAAAFTWVCVNAMSFLVVVPIMHRKLLPGQQWRWYVRDIGLPTFAAITVAASLALLLPMEGGRLRMAVSIGGAGVAVLAAAAWVSPVIRQNIRVFVQLRPA
jgi:O-antigen/teichoic acid export membrane protein